MKRILSYFLLFSLLLTGCGWMDGSYSSVTAHQQHSGGSDSQIVVAENYLQLRTALENMVIAGVENSVISVAEFRQEQLENSMEMAIRYIKSSFPIGAYAVEQIEYEVGTSGGVTAVAVQIRYLHSRTEIRKIQQVADMEEAKARIVEALANYDSGLVLLIGNYEAADIYQMVEDYALENPSVVMETPEVTEQIYPNSGKERVLELKFTYQSSRESLRSMQEQVQRIFSSAALYVSTDAEEEQELSQLYAFLMERFSEYQIKTSITPAYSLLNHGVGDSKAFATVYAEMCRRAGLECMTVVGTKNGSPWCWNIVRQDGYYYHVDLLACSERGTYRALTDNQMANYVWDYSAYPACTGEPPAPATEETVPPTEKETAPAEQENTLPEQEPT